MADEVTKNVTIKIGAKDTSGGVLASLEKRMDSVKSKFGRRGIFGDFGEILTGGGIVAGVTFMARAIGDAAEKAGELAEKFHSGQIGIEQLTADLARSIPVLGQMVTMWDKIAIAAAKASGVPSGAIDARGGWSALFQRGGAFGANMLGMPGVSSVLMADLKSAGLAENKRVQDEETRKAIAEKNARDTDIRSRVAETLRDEGRMGRIAGLSGGALAIQKIEEDYAQRKQKLTEALEKLSKQYNDESEIQKKQISERLANLDRERTARLESSKQDAMRETDKAIKDAWVEFFRNERQQIGARRSLISDVAAMMSPGAFPGFASLEESRTATGAGASSREQYRRQWDQSMLGLMERATDAVESLERNVDINNLAELFN